jgi:hypothetical protein
VGAGLSPLQVGYLDTHADVALVYCDAVVSGETPLAGRRYMQAAPSDGEATLIALIEQRCNILLSTVVARRKTIVAAGLFNDAIPARPGFRVVAARRASR